jgi:hypothetical protein
MTGPDSIDAGKLAIMLTDLRLPTIKRLWPDFAARADKEGWPAARFLTTLGEHEIAERSRRRFERHLEEARLPPGKTLDAFDFDAVPMVSKAQVMALAAGDAWLDKGANLIGSARPRAHRERRPCPLRPHNRSRTKTAGRPPRSRPRSRHREARQICAAHSRRSRLRHQRSGRDLRPLRTHQRPLRTAVAADYRQSALR